jgi:hypothetical protein
VLKVYYRHLFDSLLKTFINAEHLSQHVIMWQVIIHLTFLVSLWPFPPLIACYTAPEGSIRWRNSRIRSS